MSFWADVKDLPAPVQRALESVGYGRSNIRVEPSETVVLGDRGAGNGRQSFATLVNLTTGQYQTSYGSWGGVNMFDRGNPVDNDTRPYALPADGVAITGSRGGTQPVWAQLHIPTTMVDRMIASAPEVSKAERDALYCHGSIRGGTYRKEELRRRRVTDETIAACVAKGWLAQNRAGARTITTAGRNALGDYRGFGD